MIIVPKEAFSITHYDSLLSGTTRGAGTNIIPNPGFEVGGFSSWTNTNWTAVDATGTTPNGIGQYVAQAGSASYGQTSTLESNRVAVSGSSDYMASIAFAAPSGADKRANNLKVTVRWWNNSVGGSLLREDTLWASPVKPNKGGMRYVQMTLTSPAAATWVSFVIRNSYASSVSGYGVLADDPYLAGVVTTAQLSALDVWQYRAGDAGFHNLKFGTHFRQGCKKMTFRLRGSQEYLWFLMQTALGHHIALNYPGRKPFAGMLWGMKGRIGRRSMAISLDSLGNFIKVPYKSTYIPVSDAESLLRYGRKDWISDKSFNTKNDARAYGEFLLNQLANPIPMATDDDGNSREGDYLDMTVMGLFATLQWVTDLPPVWIGFRDTADVMATMTPRTVLGGKSLLDRVREDTPNDFITNDYANVETTGVTIPPLENTARRSSQDILLDLADRGTSHKRGVVCGVDADRKFFLRERPTTLTYSRFIDPADGHFSYLDAGGNEVPRPLVACGEWMTDGTPVANFTPVPGSDAARDPANRFITAVDYDHEGNTVSVELLGQRRIGLDLARAIRNSKAAQLTGGPKQAN